MANADSGTWWLATRRSNAINTNTDRLTPANTVSTALGPMKRTTARYRPNTAKKNSAEAAATRK